MARPVVHFEIGATDAAKINEFYRQMFDWSIDTSMPGYGLIAATGGGGIGGGILQTREGMPPYLTFYVAVDDLAAALVKAESLGGKTIVPPTPIPNVGAFAMFEDPEGHMIGLMKEA
jgi:predicted enzyme related to lactoylglutathione lyase